MVYGLDDKIKFGQYKGKAIRWIIQHDPDYAAWAYDEVAGFDLDEEAEAALDEAYFEGE